MLVLVAEGTTRAALLDMASRVAYSVGMLRPSLLRGSKVDLLRWSQMRACDFLGQD